MSYFFMGLAIGALLGALVTVEFIHYMGKKISKQDDKGVYTEYQG